MDKTKYLFIQCGQKHWNFVTVQCPHSYKMFQIYFKSASALLIWKWRNTFIIIHHKCKKRKKIVEIKRSLCRRLLFVNVYLIFISDKDIFQNKQYSQYIHQYADFLFLSFTCNNVDDHIGDNTHGDTFRNAVHKRHGDDCNVAWNCFCKIVEVDLRNGSKH